jgi:hypothetical protein
MVRGPREKRRGRQPQEIGEYESQQQYLLLHLSTDILHKELSRQFQGCDHRRYQCLSDCYETHRPSPVTYESQMKRREKRGMWIEEDLDDDGGSKIFSNMHSLTESLGSKREKRGARR